RDFVRLKKASAGADAFSAREAHQMRFLYFFQINDVSARSDEQKYLTSVVYSSCKKLRPEDSFRAFLLFRGVFGRRGGGCFYFQERAMHKFLKAAAILLLTASTPLAASAQTSNLSKAAGRYVAGAYQGITNSVIGGPYT